MATIDFSLKDYIKNRELVVIGHVEKIDFGAVKTVYFENVPVKESDVGRNNEDKNVAKYVEDIIERE